MLLLTLLSLAMSAASPSTPPPAVAAIPLEEKPGRPDAARRAFSEALIAAVHVACTERGLRDRRVDSVTPIAEAMQACRSERCRLQTAARLAVQHAVLGALDDTGARVRLVDTATGALISEVTLTGTAPTVLAGVPGAVDLVLEELVPAALHRRERAQLRAQQARAKGLLDVADAAFADAIAQGPLDDVAAELWLARARLWDMAADHARAESTWDALIAAIGPGTAGAALLSDDTRDRLHATIRDHLVTRPGGDDAGVAVEPRDGG